MYGYDYELILKYEWLSACNDVIMYVWFGDPLTKTKNMTGVPLTLTYRTQSVNESFTSD